MIVMNDTEYHKSTDEDYLRRNNDYCRVSFDMVKVLKKERGIKTSTKLSRRRELDIIDGFGFLGRTSIII